MDDIIKQIQASNAPQDVKDFVVSRLNDPSLSPEEKGKVLSDFFNKKLSDIDEQESAAAQNVISDAEKELDEIEKEYEATMNDLDKEAQKVQQELNN